MMAIHPFMKTVEYSQKCLRKKDYAVCNLVDYDKDDKNDRKSPIAEAPTNLISIHRRHARRIRFDKVFILVLHSYTEFNIV